MGHHPSRPDAAQEQSSRWYRANLDLLVEFEEAEEIERLAPATRLTRMSKLLAFCGWLGDRNILKAGSGDVAFFLDSRGPLKPSSRWTYLGALHAFYNWAQSQDLVDVDPAAPFLRQRRRIDRGPFTELAHEWQVAQERRGILPSSIQTRRHQLRRFSDFLEALRRYGLPRSGYVFRKPGGRPIAAFTVSTLGSEFLHTIGSPATVHQLRHWFGTRLYARTRDIRMTQELLGHSSPTTTAMYVAFNPGDAVAAVTGLAVAGGHQ